MTTTTALERILTATRDILTAVTTPQPPLPAWGVLAVGVIAALITWTPTGYRVVRHAVTIVHEAGHATVATLHGRRLHGIKLHADTSGVTVSSGRPTGLGMINTVTAGYPAPAVIGVAGAYVLSRGYATGLLWALLVVCALMLIQIRNFYGLWTILVSGLVIGATVWFLPTQAASWVAYLLVWSLLLAAPRSVVELQRARRRATVDATSDADQLARLTGLPAVTWVAWFWFLTVAGLVVGAWLLLAL